jgi:hypothetical protein
MRKEETAGRKGKQADGSSATREVKLGCIFTSTVTDEEGRSLRDPRSTTYLASFESAESFGLSLLKEARLRGLGKAAEAVILGDGAHWIWNQATINFPESIQILDYYHAREHLCLLAETIYSSKEERDHELEKWTALLNEGHIEKIADLAEKKKARNGKRRAAAEREIEYMRSNAQRMRYARFKEKGLFIGSGVVEAGCKTVVGKRTKQSGMFWKIQGAQNILDVRCSVLSDTYDAYWECRKRTCTVPQKVAA